ncbi:TetR/AcrR family transcriptional regulator [Streptomyces sp. XD-27]|uniref:TetR/AcrR family transcriptional regulator n=1 Tax=Streptomyces sp. XD-27 TaxID=3062779 RepID=UPI0026F43A4F|nr:TetR/AcrR family transcriptional regulator [Streptomyces sp. XD-27]WKX68964.1 TetR/AcrR family transcriptional regulator [Streptomyces sp. XD-27]
MPAQDIAVPARRSKITPEREREFYEAVLDLLREGGYDAVTMEGVAARTRASRSTLYRQWQTKPRLVAAALRGTRQVRLAGIDTGSLAGDLLAAARAMGDCSGIDTTLQHALGHAALNDPELMDALREALVEPELAAVESMVRRGVERGEVDADDPALEFVAAQLFGAMRIRPILEGPYADEEYLTRFVTAALLPSLGLSGHP